MKTLEQLEAEITEGLKDLKSRETSLPVARLIVEARRDHFITPRGGPDLQGRSYAWRNWYGDILRNAFPDEDRRFKVGGRVRYGIGVALREMISEDELKEAGLQKVGPKERVAVNNRERSGAYKLLTEKIRSEDDVLEVVASISRAISSINDKQLRKKLIKSLKELD